MAAFAGGASNVSLVIPYFNHADTLERAIASGLAQSALCEIIVVDDCSPQPLPAPVVAMMTSGSRIRLVTMEHNSGPGAARNAGVQAAVGSHVCFLDADDELLGDFFKEALGLMDSRPQMHAVKGEMEFFDPVKGYILPTFDPRHQSAVLSSSCGMVLDRQTLLSMGGFPEDPAFRGPFGGEDVAFMQAVMTHFQPIGRIERPCYRVWSQAGSHVDRFLANTRLTMEGFEFVRIHPGQAPGGPLSSAVDTYLAAVTARMSVDTAPT